tara:strand:- start:299 stop:1450 length:1152 start_codon:yes stop_codon:yes gene_type:complete
MGETTKFYLSENKMHYHPDIIQTHQRLKELDEICNQKIRKFNRLVYNVIPRNIQKKFHWNNIGFMFYHFNNCGMKDGVKKIKTQEVLKDLEVLVNEFINTRNSLTYKLAKSKEDYEEQCKVILATFGSLHQVSQFLKDRKKDNISITIIVDESSTLLCWQGFYIEHFLNEIGIRLINLILIGDSKQLPPYWPDQENMNQEKQSFLDLAKKNVDHIAFKTQYRLPKQVMNILNKEYYKESPLVLGHKRQINDPINWIHSDGVEDEINYSEAQNVINILSLFDVKYKMMIICPYKAQCDVLERLCLNYLPHCQVMTLDSVQGHESDIVAVSLVKSMPTTFLSPKRTCVLVSRAREKLLVFGNRQNCLSCKNGCLRKLARFHGLKY